MAGKRVYLTDKEIKALVDTASEWEQIMNDGEDTAGCVEERLKDGLGSALYKLYSSERAKRTYSRYVGKNNKNL